MALSAQHQVAAGIVHNTAGSPLGMRDVIEEEDPETEVDWTRTEGTPVLWGEFQGTQQTEGEDESDWYHKGLQRCRLDDTWVAFRDTEGEEPETEDEEVHTTQHDGRWWCEDSTTLCTREHSIDKKSVITASVCPWRSASHEGVGAGKIEESVVWLTPQLDGHIQSSLDIFENCFPPVSHPNVEEEIQPLESLLQNVEPQGHKQTWRRSTHYLQRATSEHTRDPDLLYKWKGSQLHSNYLSSLHINPNDKAPPPRTKFSASSPVPKQRPQPHKLSTGLARDPELKLMKMASVSVHVTGFSPSHHLQTLFQHWSQPSGKTRLKVAYDFNRSLLV